MHTQIPEDRLESLLRTAALAVENKAQVSSLSPALLLSLVEESMRSRLFCERVLGFLTLHHPDSTQWHDAAVAGAQGALYDPEYLPDTGTEIVDGDAQWVRLLKHKGVGDVLYRRGCSEGGPSTVVEIYHEGRFGHAIQDFETNEARDKNFSDTTDEQVFAMVDRLLMEMKGKVLEN